MDNLGDYKRRILENFARMDREGGSFTFELFRVSNETLDQRRRFLPGFKVLKIYHGDATNVRSTSTTDGIIHA